MEREQTQPPLLKIDPVCCIFIPVDELNFPIREWNVFDLTMPLFLGTSPMIIYQLNENYSNFRF